MLAVVRSINLINLAAKNQKLNVQIISNPRITKILQVLTDFNLLEYQKTGPYLTNITLKYKNNAPCLKSIKFMGGHYKNNVTFKYAVRELNNKRALYIVQTTKGLCTLDAAIKLGQGGNILFQIKV